MDSFTFLPSKPLVSLLNTFNAIIFSSRPCFEIWYGMVWYGMVWYGITLYAVGHGAVQRYGMAWYSKIIVKKWLYMNSKRKLILFCITG